MELPSKHVRFTHTPLNFKNKEIRLITIEPTTDPSSPIHITMKNVDFSGHSDALTRYQEEVARHEHTRYLSVKQKRALLDKMLQGTFRFIALSYTWGPELPTQDILVTSPECRGWLPVRQNLYEFLKAKQCWPSKRQSVHDFLEVEQDVGSASFWIDQICINQGMNDEKAHQVNQMAEIYSAAFVVECWLGPAFEGSDELLDLIIRENDLCPSSSSSMLNMSGREIPEQETRSFLPSLRQFILLPYWSRLWITQEIVLGRSVQLRIGSKALSWDTFYPGYLNLRSAWTGLSDIKEYDLEVREGSSRIHAIDHSRRYAIKDWDSFWFLLQGTQCEDPRDRVFGVMGMLHPSLRIFPDYSMCLQDILLELLTRQVVVASTKSEQWSAFHYKEEKENWIRKDCVRTAANWFPQLEDDENMISPKSVRRHILKIAPFNSPEQDYVLGLTPRLMYFIWTNIPFTRIPFTRVPVTEKMVGSICRLEQHLIIRPCLSVYRAGQAYQCRYYIWRKIPNEQNRLWRIIRAVY